MKHMTLAATAVVALLFLLTVGAPSASADIVYQLTSDHCTEGCGGDGHLFGTITLHDVSTGVVLVSLSLNDGSQLVDTGFQAAIGFNLIGNPTINLDSISNTNFSLVSSSAGALQIDGFGNFEYGLKCATCNGGSTPQGSTISFTLSDGSGFSAASFNELSTGSGSEHPFFAVDILSGITGKTGPVDATTTTVPDGGMTLMLLGGALVGLESLRRRLRA
jgi:hypothetical protein